MSKNISHSVSSIKMWFECPWKYHENKISKRAEFVQSPAMIRGDRIHNSIEAYLKSGGALDAEAEFLKPRLDKLKDRDGKLIPEGSVTIRRDESLTTWRDWREAWFRFKIDAVHIAPSGKVALVLDWKTGSSKWLDDFQTESYAVALSLKFPELEAVKAQYVLIDEDGRATKPLIMKRDEIERAKERLYEKAFEVESGIQRGAFDCKENRFCNWCSVREQGFCLIKDAG